MSLWATSSRSYADVMVSVVVLAIAISAVS